MLQIRNRIKAKHINDREESLKKRIRNRNKILQENEVIKEKLNYVKNYFQDIIPRIR